ELDQFARLKVWRLVPRPEGKTIIKTKWIFKNKKDESNLVIRNKARLVAIGYCQQEGINCDEASTPVANPNEHHVSAVKRIFRYLKGTINLGLWYPKDSGFDLTAYSDADHAGCHLDRKSTSGSVQFLGDKLVCWSSKKQNCVSISTAESEYVVVSGCCAQVLWMRTQLTDYGFFYDKVPIYCDSKSAIAISCNPVQHTRTKHIDVRYHFIKDHVEKGTIELYFVGTEFQLADLFTKSLPEARFKFLVEKLGKRSQNEINLDVPSSALTSALHYKSYAAIGSAAELAYPRMLLERIPENCNKTLTSFTCKCAEGNKVIFAATTLQDSALTWWNNQVAYMGCAVANSNSWTEMKAMMTEEFCPPIRNPSEWSTTKWRLIRGLFDNIQEEVTSSSLTTLSRTIRMAHKLMEQKRKSKMDREVEANKRKWESFQPEESITSETAWQNVISVEKSDIKTVTVGEKEWPRWHTNSINRVVLNVELEALSETNDRNKTTRKEGYDTGRAYAIKMSDKAQGSFVVTRCPGGDRGGGKKEDINGALQFLLCGSFSVLGVAVAGRS
ncbi:retrovirus-related pol polyprotein from transposon TNT 1-94, partial [Tanacetum coccineum]